jgi:phosphate transport system protein
MNTATEIQGTHISQQYHVELDQLRNRMIETGGIVERQLSDAVFSLLECDSDLAQKVILCDDEIDSLERKIDEESYLIIAKRQPAAGDLRLVLTITKIIRDLERMGDESAKIARMAIKLGEELDSRIGFVEFKHIADRVQDMVRNCLDAFARNDVVAAIRVVREDTNVDMEYSSAMRAMATYMIEDPRCITRVLNMMWSLRALERIGDHAKNISEQIIYLVNGRDIRYEDINQYVSELML